VHRVLLTIDLGPEELLEAVDRTGVNGVQPYGRNVVAASNAAIAAGLMVLQPIRIGEPGDDPTAVAGAIPLFDTHRRDRYGGTGETFDWGLLDDRRGNYVVAGGLGPDNVGDLVRRVRPWGVDASSRLESSPGVKDLGKVAAFVGEAKRT
jgi:phosphoribosylanthranilate isomerase